MSKDRAEFFNNITGVLAIRTGRKVLIVTKHEHIVQIFSSVTKAKKDTRLMIKIWKLKNKYDIVFDHTNEWKKIMAGAYVKIKKLGHRIEDINRDDGAGLYNPKH